MSCAIYRWGDTCQEGFFNAHNSCVCSTNNPHATRPRAYEQRFCRNVCAGIVNDFLTGPYLYLLPTEWRKLSYFSGTGVIRTATWYSDHLSKPHVVSAWWGATPLQRLCAYLPECQVWGSTYWAWWTSLLAIRCLPFFCPYNYFLPRHLKNFVYETPLDLNEEFVAYISKAAPVYMKYLVSLTMCTNRSTNAVNHVSLLVDTILISWKKWHCCKGHPAQQKHSFLVLSAGKSSNINFPA